MKCILLILAAMMAISACGPEDAPKVENVPLAIDSKILTFDAEGGQKTFSATTSEQLFLVPGDDWVKVQKGTVDAAHRTVVTVTVSPNPDVEQRSTRISVVAGEDKQYVEIEQKGKAVEPEPEPVVPVPEDNAAWKMASKLGIGWNLGNHFDAHNNGVSGETFWGNPKATQATFNKIKAAGFSTVRIPVTWLGHMGEAPDYQIEEAWLNRVAEVVGYAEAAGLNAIVNIHHDGADSKFWLDIKTAAINPAVHEQIKEQIAAMWSQIAKKFADKGDFLIFEAFNEIHEAAGAGAPISRTEESSMPALMNGIRSSWMLCARRAETMQTVSSEFRHIAPMWILPSSHS